MTESSISTGCSPHAAGSISIGLHAHEGSAVEIVEHVVSEARRAAGAGFDGVTFSEHHGGFPGYLPNPIQMAALVLEAVPDRLVGPEPVRAPAPCPGDGRRGPRVDGRPTPRPGRCRVRDRLPAT